jgi:hypothetical protein
MENLSTTCAMLAQKDPMLDSSKLLLTTALVSATLAASTTVLAAEVSKVQSSGPSMSAQFQRLSPITCTDGTSSVLDETIFVSAAKFRDKFDGQQVRFEGAYATIFALNGCTGETAAGSGDFLDFEYSQASVQRARFSGSTEVINFVTRESMGVLDVDFTLIGVGAVVGGVDHVKTTELGNYRMTEVIQGQGRASSFVGSATLDGAELAPFFTSPIYSLLDGHYVATIVSF